ncbi:unnamed protein product, partial [Hymenolepis diminuta]
MCQRILLELTNIDRIPFDFKRCYTITCRNLELSNHPVIWKLALDLQNDCIEHMSKTEIDEVGSNSSCMKCLLKYAAEVYLGESEVNALISAHGEERLSYLRNFLRLHDNDNRLYSELSDEIVIEMMQKLANSRPHVCENVVNYGGYEILTKILQMTKSRVDLVNTVKSLKKLLQILKPYFMKIKAKTVTCKAVNCLQKFT